MTFRFRALIEDVGHEAMLRGLLDLKSSATSLRVEPYPKGKGAGEQHVRKNLPSFVKDLRTKRNQQGLWGIVVADGDTVGLAGRRAVLVAAIAAAGLAPLTAADRILMLVPTRNVETWAWCILGHGVDETTDYKPLLRDQPLRKLFERHWSPPQGAEPTSLTEGRSEWARLP